MPAESGTGHTPPPWFVSPGETDFLAWIALLLLLLAIYAVFYLYAAFDRWAEHRSQNTPLAKTIPTMLTIALLYEVFPLNHFNILLPIAAILVALMADLTHTRFASIFSIADPQVIAPSDVAEVEMKDGVAGSAMQDDLPETTVQDVSKIEDSDNDLQDDTELERA